ncbi:MAG: DUF4428 domain-containing protein [Ruminococcaceae bacterium]|nr:DUF4428 domain-containing protein [Oscillospiraceae bacterium]
MGLFDKKYCDVCGGKIGLLGNRKLEDGNLCKDCAAKLSPWFSERRHSTLADIKDQLAYREQNRQAVSAFHTTRSFGKNYKVLLDDDARKFMVTNASKLADANPDVLDFSQVTGCDLDVDEDRDELKKEGPDGKEVSYTPPRYEYSYDFYLTVRVNHPYFDEMRFKLNSSSVSTGTHSMSVPSSGMHAIPGANEYQDYVRMGNEIKEALTRAPQAQAAPTQTPQPPQAEAVVPTPKGPVKCPLCGATTTPDAKGCCEYCGSPISG